MISILFAVVYKANTLFLSLPLPEPGDAGSALSTQTGPALSVSVTSLISLPPWLTILAGITLILLVLYILARKDLRFARLRFKLEGIIHERTEELLSQKEKVDELLSNMLPKETASQLKLTGKASSRKYNMVTILFSDIEGFTRIAEQMNPEILVDELDKFFFHFDALVEEFNIEKIKTIGDAYMAAGGIPDANTTNPVDVVLAAIRIMQHMKRLKEEKENFWDLRIGIHTGPVIAGVVGQKKLSFDIWGDSVNTASRMESSGETGQINISGSTFEYIKDFFVCEYRGKMPVKYKGNIDMYFVKGFRPEYSVDMKGEEPNRRFFTKLQFLRLRDLEEEYLAIMEDELPAALCFHNHKYCVDLLTRCDLLAGSEQLSEEERLAVRTAALFDCYSYIRGYSERDGYIDQLSREVFIRNKYTEKQARDICDLLKAPLFPPTAGSMPGMVLSDARLAFIGKPGLKVNAEKLYEEMNSYGMVSSKEDFIKNMARQLKSFEFYTLTARKLSEVSPRHQSELLTEKNGQSGKTTSQP
ncbi:MAG: adenylate/guanylate cyclase domain-containing protein [Marinilabiliales bacterium]|nr:MAG: adenylate/guanylate cyclase domain-containing protein [Marinilabiliales bacterium]